MAGYLVSTLPEQLGPGGASQTTSAQGSTGVTQASASASHTCPSSAQSVTVGAYWQVGSPSTTSQVPSAP